MKQSLTYYIASLLLFIMIGNIKCKSTKPPSPALLYNTPDSLIHKWECPSAGLKLNKPPDIPKPGIRTLPGNEIDNKTYPWDLPRDSVKLLPKNSWKDFKVNTSSLVITSTRKDFKSILLKENKTIEVQIDGLNVATRDTSGNWNITNPEAALEAMWEISYPYMKKEYLISKMLSYVDDNGYVSDWQEFQKSVFKYRQFIKK